jgi:DNA-directed RNA polymerase subunit M/transcription elongation factor TFIIS
MAPEYIFMCRKCEHLLYVKKFAEKTIVDLPNYHCPKCGEEGHLNWIAMGEGDFADFEGEKIDE